MDSQWMLAVLVAIGIVLAAIAIWIYLKAMRSRRLKTQFGPEYDRTVERLHDRESAEAELQERERRVKRFHVVPLTMEDRSQLREQWTAIQAHFVDDPKGAVQEAHQLVHEVMKKKGYPVTDSEQAAADLSVEYPTLVTDYRAASRIVEINRKGVAETEELRKALVYYRPLFRELLEASQTEIKDEPRKKAGFQKLTRGGLRP